MIPNDQAAELRQLARQAAPAPSGKDPCGAKRVVVTSGKGGVGTSTVALNLAVKLAAEGKRVILVDAHPGRSDIARLCHIEERYSLGDVLAGRCPLNDAFCCGPAGVEILPGPWGCDPLEIGPELPQHLCRQLSGLTSADDWLLLDVGTGLTRAAKQFWQLADLVIAVTTPDLNAVMDTYAAIKVLSTPEAPVHIGSLVNMAPDWATTAGVQSRLSQACRRFLGRKLHSFGCISHDPAVPAAACSGVPVVLQEPGPPVAAQFRRLATGVAAVLGHRPSVFARLALARPKAA